MLWNRFNPGYNQSFLRADEAEDGFKLGAQDNEMLNMTKAQSYLAECSYSVDLGNLYKMNGEHGTCAYNEEMEYSPVQIQVHTQIRHLHGGANYLLQVWSRTGIKVYQERLNRKIKQWAICFDHFIYRTQEGDKNHEYLQILNIKTSCVTLVSTNWFTDEFEHFAYNGNKLFAASKTCIRIVPVKLISRSTDIEDDPQNPIIRYIDESHISEISFAKGEDEKDQEHKIHKLGLTSAGLRTDTNHRDFILVFIEIAGQNLISINELVVQDGYLKPYEFKYQFVEWREFVERKTPTNDPIVDYQFVFKRGNIHAGAAVRESGHFDIYYNGNLIDSPANYRCQQIMVTFENILFDLKKKTDQVHAFRLLKHNMSFGSNSKMTGKVLTSNLLFTERVKDSFKLFSGLILIETNVFVAHGRHISQFYLKNQRFELRKDKHFSFTAYIRFIFKRQHVNKITKEIIDSVGVLLENGEIHVISSYTPSDYKTFDLDEQIEAQRIQIPGTILRCSNDPVQFRCNLFLSSLERLVDPSSEEGKLRRDESEFGVRASSLQQKAESQHNQHSFKTPDLEVKKEIRAYIFNDKKYDITDVLKNANISMDEKDQLVGMFEQNKDSHFLYFEHARSKLYLFVCLFTANSNAKSKRKRARKLMKQITHANR